MSDLKDSAIEPAQPRRRSPFHLGRTGLVAASLALCAAGAALGAGGTRIAQNWAPQQVMLLQPANISDFREDTTVAAKGTVQDIYGNKFVLQDSTGRVLVDLGPRGEDRPVVTVGESVTVQGRFERSIVRAQLVAHADGRNDAFGPPGPKGPKEPPKGPKGLKERADRGPPPPPPPGPDDEDTPPRAPR